jgi:hypothetical protein
VIVITAGDLRLRSSTVFVCAETKPPRSGERGRHAASPDLGGVPKANRNLDEDGTDRACRAAWFGGASIEQLRWDKCVVAVVPFSGAAFGRLCKICEEFDCGANERMEYVGFSGKKITVR